MFDHLRTLAVAAMAVMCAAPAWCQGSTVAAKAKAEAKTWTVPRTPDGQPDLQGTWSNTTLTPAFLSFNASFNSNEWGVGAALAFILFAIIVFFTLVTRLATRNPDHVPKRRRFGPTQPISRQDASRVASTGSGGMR